MFTRCIYCGSTSFGLGCDKSPNRIHSHCHSTDQNACMYCGTNAYGYCKFSPTGKHCHGPSRPGEFGKCRWCGSQAYGSCSTSPTGKHEH
jgi:hypothetical protein